MVDVNCGVAGGEKGTGPDPRFLGGANEPVLIDTRQMALSIAVGFDGACDVSANVPKPEAARILRQIADQWDPPKNATAAVGAASPDDGAAGDPPPPSPSSCPTCRVPNQDQRTAEEWAGIECSDPWHLAPPTGSTPKDGA